MTRAEIITDAQGLLGEAPGSEAALDPFQWDRHVSRTADELCRDAHCLYATFRTDVAAGRGLYAAPPVFEIDRAELTLADGEVVRLSLLTAEQFTARYRPYGYPDAAWGGPDPLPCDRPRLLALRGASGVSLWPPPDFTAEAALAVTGYSTCGDWSAPGDCCPLPESSSECVILGAALRRAREKPAQYGERIPLLAPEYRDQRARLVSESRGQTQAARALGPYVDTGPPVACPVTYCGYW